MVTDKVASVVASSPIFVETQVENTSSIQFESYRFSAEDYIRKGKLKTALEIYREFVTRFPDFDGAYRELGIVKEKLEDFDGQVESYRKALSLNVYQPFWLYMTLAKLLAEKSQIDSAIELYKQGFELYPEKADGIYYARMAHLLSKRGDFEEAIETYRIAFELQPDLDWVEFCIEAIRYNQGVNYLMIGDFKSAQNAFQQVSQVKPCWEIPVWFGKEDNHWPTHKFDWIDRLKLLKNNDAAWPKISVVIPSLNQREFVEETLLSVLNQDYANLECIVIDGDSTDGTLSILDKYRSEISTVLIEPDKGQSSAINKGFRLATGELIGWLNSDDMLAPSALYQVALAYLESESDVIAGICTVHRDQAVEMVRKPKIRSKDFNRENLTRLDRWEAGDFFFQPEVFFSRKIWEKSGGALNEKLHYAMDHDLWLRLSQSEAKLNVIDWPIAIFRKHNKQKTNNSEAAMKELINVITPYSDTNDMKLSTSLMEQTTPIDFIILIETLFENKAWHKMLDTCHIFVKAHPDEAEGYRWLGLAQEKVEDFEGQLCSYQKTIGLNPLQPEWVYLVAAQLLIKQREWRQSIDLLQQAIALYPNNAEAYRWLGFCYEYLGSHDDEINNYQKAIELDSAQPDWVHTTLSKLLESKVRFDNAVAANKKTVEADRKHKISVSRKESDTAVRGSISTIEKVGLRQTSTGIEVFMPYYKAQTHERQEEFIYCLKKNIECDEIEKLYLLIDDGHTPELSHPKIEIIALAKRPTYLDWIELTGKKCPGKISVLANTDIYFDQSVAQLGTLLSQDSEGFVALSRYEKEKDEHNLHPNPHWSQDVWAINGAYEFTKSFRQSLNISLGVPRCDNKIAYLFAIHGAKVYNPCLQVKTVHVHETQQRSYSKKGDTSILGGTAWVYPVEEINQPSQLHIDVWTLNSSEIIGIKANDSLLRWKNREKTPPKQIIAFDSDWQFPAITEKHAYIQLTKQLANTTAQYKVVYFGFPWATLIDQSLHGQADSEDADVLMNKLLSYKDELRRYDSVITVCQHIHLKQFEYLFSEVGVTDIFWTHATKSDIHLPADPHVLIHPFPLYPVQAVENKNTATGQGRNHLYSFVGTRAPSNYLTDSRNKIIDHLSNDKRGLIIARDQWHYNKVVYDHQIFKKADTAKGLVNQSASEEFKRAMQESIFALCPSGTGPNSIRLWESMGFGAIPVLLADTYLPPGDLSLWEKATVTCPETLDDIQNLPGRLAKIASNPELLEIKRHALKQLWQLYGPDNFSPDVVSLFNKYRVSNETKRMRSPSKGKLSLPAKPPKKKVDKKSFKPSYTWPEPKFPFRLYYDSPKCRIFIIENVQHNWDWMSKCHGDFRKTDFFFVMSGWYQSPAFANEADTIFSVLNLDKENFFFLYNSDAEMNNFAKKGFKGEVINQGAWLNEKFSMQPMNSEKLYDAIYLNFHRKSSRIELSCQVASLALVTTWSFRKDAPPEISQYGYMNDKQLSEKEIAEKINQSRCGLILSEEEGACEASSNYLLCGVPVISTPSKGGRDVWYNKQNSIICEPTPQAVAESVAKATQTSYSPSLIRQMYLDQSEGFRNKFVQVLANTFERFGVKDVVASAYFEENFFHKMRGTKHLDKVETLFINSNKS